MARTRIAPLWLVVPAETVAPTRFCTGRLSPLSIDSSTEEAPSTTTPSAGTRPPGFTTRTSPIATSSSGFAAAGQLDGLRQEAAERARLCDRVVDAPLLQPLAQREEEDDRRRLPEVADRHRAGARDQHRRAHVERTLVDDARHRAHEEHRRADGDRRERKVRERVVLPRHVRRPRPDAERGAEEHEEREREAALPRERAPLQAGGAAAAAALDERRAEERPVEDAHELRRLGEHGVMCHRHLPRHQVRLDVGDAGERAELRVDQLDLRLAAHAGDVELGDDERW